MKARKALKDILMAVGINITRNMKYDSMAKKIIRRVLKRDSNCIDIGSHEGEFIEFFQRYAPSGEHFAFEPIPSMYKELKERYSPEVTVYPYALSDHSGKSTFQYVRNAPAYSGLKKREYKTKSPDIQELKVELALLDDLIPSGLRIDFIKIDVEGAEFEVLKGAQAILKENRPVVLFEFGKGASDFYGSRPKDLYRFITRDMNMRISSLPAFLKDEPPYTAEGFEQCYEQLEEYYFIAH